MDFLTKKEKVFNQRLFYVLLISLLFVPFAKNDMIRLALTFLIFLLFINTVSIITKFVIYKLNNGKRSGK